jgi:hypothetical protein
MDCLLPDKDVLLQPSDPITRTFMSFTIVCKETRRIALRHLRAHCVYLDGEDRLRRFVAANGLVNTSSTDLNRVTSLYLSLGTPSSEAESLVRKLFSLIGPFLKRLILDVELDLDPDDVDPEILGITERVRNCLQEVLRDQKVIEDFVCFSGGLDPPDPPVWADWQQLRRIALPHYLSTTRWFWRGVTVLPKFSTVVLFPDSFPRIWTADYTPRSEFFRQVNRKIEVLLFYLKKEGLVEVYETESDWNAVDIDGKMRILWHSATASSPVPCINPRGSVGSLVFEAAVGGTLWDWKRALLKRPMGSEQAAL